MADLGGGTSTRLPCSVAAPPELLVRQRTLPFCRRRLAFRRRLVSEYLNSHNNGLPFLVFFKKISVSCVYASQEANPQNRSSP